MSECEREKEKESECVCQREREREKLTRKRERQFMYGQIVHKTRERKKDREKGDKSNSKY